MRIACLISEYLPSIGGAQICIHNIANELKKNNCRITVITTTPENTAHDYGYQVVRISKWYLKLLRVPVLGQFLLWYCLNRLQREHKFDIWHVTVGYPLGAYAVSFFKRKKMKRFVILLLPFFLFAQNYYLLRTQDHCVLESRVVPRNFP